MAYADVPKEVERDQGVSKVMAISVVVGWKYLIVYSSCISIIIQINMNM